MKKISLIFAACSMAVATQAQTVDDFSGSLSAYTLTPVLYSGGTVPATTTITFSDPSGALQATAANYSNIEQALFLRSDFTLGINQRLRVDANWSPGNQDFGLCVASTATPPAASTNPLGNTRTSLSYGFIGLRSTTDHVVSSGFDGATGLSTVQVQPGGATITSSLFITRTSANAFDFGYNQGAGDVVLRSFTFANSANVGNAIGFYVDMRAAGTVGTMDNLRIEAVPEPGTLSFLVLGGLGSLLVIRRRK